ncbi:hypothetical protein [Marinilabilia rubra]|uniref:hypothetical protein n=1 Tax=Marinilabilia rubra TaxID=2162893 RepID=UPI00130492E9|nr:hypothetical protein [Marinilabilia rubra]
MQRARPAKELEDVDPLSGILGEIVHPIPGTFARACPDKFGRVIRIRRFQRQGGSSV